jgi:hypothetical protein
VRHLVRPDQPAQEQDLDQLRAQVAELEALLDARAADVDRVSRELDLFAANYHQQVGTLHEQLDHLELDIAELELGEISKRVAEGGPASRATPSQAAAAAMASEGAGRYTSDAVRKLFREVARAIHPDLADDDHTRDWRHRLMIEANRAYALRDAEQLGRILEAWERSPEAVQGSDPASMRLRLERRLAQIHEHLDRCDRSLTELRGSSLFELKTMVDEASARGRDLVADMVRRLRRDILAATNRRDAMRFTP